MLLETQNLSIGYGRLIVQQNLNLSVSAGNLICLIGTNGSGKSTLLRTLAGLQKPLKGTVLVQDSIVSRLSQHERALIFSLVLTDFINEENMTVFDIVSLGRFPYTNWLGDLSSKDREIIQEAIGQVNLTRKECCYLREISDGEKQRAIIAKALTQDTPLVLLDEPTAYLDLPNRIEIMLLLRRLSLDTGKTFILSTHELDLAMQMSDRIWLMHSDGIEVGIPEDLMLTGRLQHIFGSNSFMFDRRDGHFCIRHTRGDLRVQVFGDEIPVLWTIRALNRMGIVVEENADIQVQANSNRFAVRRNEFSQWQEASSIEALLQFICLEL
ncbi:MAG: ABC transporter ATP-binding protein [Bacteroidales bacterium]|jgi:iron complex transport system ATP-binding protein|nr:ABC transporter ATP-binding protein [Bacteroidales bacterium]